MADLHHAIELFERIADELDECCLIIDESGRNTKNVKFHFPGLIDHRDVVKDAELYDIDTKRLLFILDVELKDVLTKLLHYSPGNGQRLERDFKPIKEWAISLDTSPPRPSITRLPRMADYSDLVIETVCHLTRHLPARANDLRRVAMLLAEDNKQIIQPQKEDGQGKTQFPDEEMVKIQTAITRVANRIDSSQACSKRRGHSGKKDGQSKKLTISCLPLGSHFFLSP